MAAARGRRRGGEPLADRAYAELRDRLVTLQIPPGAPINEDHLGRELELGRTPLREAIKRLALESLVIVYPRRGTFATEINITDLTAISDVRAVLEGHAAYRAAQHLAGGYDFVLRALQIELDDHRDTEDPRILMSIDADVHRFIHRATGNPYLEVTLTRYLNLSLRIWHLALERLPDLAAHIHEHRGLLDAIELGDAERARSIMTDHITTFADEIRAVL